MRSSMRAGRKGGIGKNEALRNWRRAERQLYSSGSSNMRPDAFPITTLHSLSYFYSRSISAPYLSFEPVLEARIINCASSRVPNGVKGGNEKNSKIKKFISFLLDW